MDKSPEALAALLGNVDDETLETLSKADSAVGEVAKAAAAARKSGSEKTSGTGSPQSKPNEAEKVVDDPVFIHCDTYEIERASKLYNEPVKPMIEELSTDTFDYIQHYLSKEHYNFYSRGTTFCC